MIRFAIVFGWIAAAVLVARLGIGDNLHTAFLGLVLFLLGVGNGLLIAADLTSSQSDHPDP